MEREVKNIMAYSQRRPLIPKYTRAMREGGRETSEDGNEPSVYFLYIYTLVCFVYLISVLNS